MDEYSSRLLTTIDGVFDGWIRGLITNLVIFDAADSSMIERMSATIAEAREVGMTGLRDLLNLDAEQQRSNPLAVLRMATQPVTRFLESVAVPPVQRDEFSRRSFPDDLFGLAPATWADVDPSLVEPGLEWGAWKAATIIGRRREQT